MSSIVRCKLMNKSGKTPYIKMYGDEYFIKGWFRYKPAIGPDGKMSSGAMAHAPKTKFKRGQRFIRRGSEYLPGWGTVAGNLTLTQDFNADLENIMSQPEVHGVFWVDSKTDEVVADWFKNDEENQIS